MIPIRWTGPARRDLLSVLAYMGTKDPPAADRVLDRIVMSVDSLRAHPAKGRDGRVAGTRELVIFGTPYVVAYRAGEGRVDVLRVVQAARRWPRSPP